MKKVAVVFNGGTISMKVDPRIKAAVPTLTGEEIMHMVTGIEKFAEIESFTFSNLPGPHVTPEIMLDLSKYVKQIMSRKDIDGIVITHGTDTLEETAYLLDLTINNEKPIVLTGSMRNSSELGYDGPANLAASICTVISEQAKNRGVLVCLNNELNCASEVVKTHSMHLNTFQSPEFGSIGVVDNNEVLFYRDNTHKQRLITNKLETRVSLIKSTAGMDSKFIDTCIESGDKGIVIEAMGRGNLPPSLLPSIKMAIDKKIAVVIVTRCFKGRVLDTYGYKGGGKQLREMGIIFGGDLPGQKARIKLMCALGITKDINIIKEIFEDGQYSIISEKR